MYTVSRTIATANDNTQSNNKTNKSNITNNRSIGSYSRYVLSSLSPISSSSSRLTLATNILTNSNAPASNPAVFLQQHLLTQLHNNYRVFSRY